MSSGVYRFGLLAMAMLLLPTSRAARAQQPTPSVPPADSTARRDTTAARRDTTGPRTDTVARAATGAALSAARPASNACSDPMYIQLRQIPLERMDDNQRRAYEELDRACAEARVDEARRRMASSGFIDRPDYAREVVPWIIGVVMFCTGVIMFAQTAR